MRNILLNKKNNIRNKISERRLKVGDSKRNKAAQEAAFFLKDTACFQSATHVACYLARTEEFDCGPIIQLIWKLNKNCYLPVLDVSLPNNLHFVSYQPNDHLMLNRYRILEPEKKNLFSPAELDLVILPLVAFDNEGNRLGMGGGYYDKTFEFKKSEKLSSPILLGVGYEFQRVDLLPKDPWDISLDGILTEKNIQFF